MDEDAIQRCFQHAVQSHHSDQMRAWKAPAVNVFRDWEPKVLNVAPSDNDDAGKKEVELAALPGKDFHATVMLDFESPILKAQHATLQSVSQFQEEFADSRTFCFLHELKALNDAGLIQGQNAFEIKGTNADGTDSKTGILVYKPTIVKNPPVITVLTPAGGLVLSAVVRLPVG